MSGPRDSMVIQLLAAQTSWPPVTLASAWPHARSGCRRPHRQEICVFALSCTPTTPAHTVQLGRCKLSIITKNYWKFEKRLCVRLRSGDKHHLRKSADRTAEIRKAFVPLTGLICAFRSADFLRWCLSSERNLTHNLFFLFPIVFGINLIHFFDEKKDGAAGNSIVCFGASIPCHAIWQKPNEERVLFRRAQRFLATESVNSAPFKRGEPKVQIFGKENCNTLRQY